MCGRCGLHGVRKLLWILHCGQPLGSVLDRSPSSQNNGGTQGSSTSSSGNLVDSGSGRGLFVFIVVAILVTGILVGFLLFRRCRRREGKQIAGPVADTNIAAVSAVSDSDLT